MNECAICRKTATGLVLIRLGEDLYSAIGYCAKHEANVRMAYAHLMTGDHITLEQIKKGKKKDQNKPKQIP